MPDRAVSDDPSVQEQLDRLATVSLPRDVLGFSRIKRLLRKLGNPELSLPPVFHVAGTNGKGSTCSFLRACLEAADLKVHVYTSPHLVALNERIRICGQLVSDEQLTELLSVAIDAVEGEEITFFEATTAAAFLAFARHPADACIIEVGIGGRLDATNVIPSPIACGITQLGLDHQIYLGNSLEAIAREKAGIAKHNVPLVTDAYATSIDLRIAEAARSAGAPWFRRKRDWSVEVEAKELLYSDGEGSLSLPKPRLQGAHQSVNAALAVAMIRHQSEFRISASAFRAGIGWAEWPARLQRLAPGPLHRILPAGSELWLDGAHNSAAAQAVADFFRSHVPAGAEFHVILGMLSDRDPSSVLGPFADRRVVVHPVTVSARESHPPELLAEVARRNGMRAIPAVRVESSLDWIARHADPSAPPIVLIVGSLYLAGEVLAANGQPPA